MLLLFNLVLLQIAGASRYHPLAIGLAPTNGVVFHTVNASLARGPMTYAALGPGRVPGLEMKFNAGVLYPMTYESSAGARRFQQEFPPPKIQNTDVRRTLRTWASNQKVESDVDMVTQKMVDDFDYLKPNVETGHFEVVGLIANQEIPGFRSSADDSSAEVSQPLSPPLAPLAGAVASLTSGEPFDRRDLGQRLGTLLAAGSLREQQRAGDRALEAVAVFSRERLKDNSKGSLLKVVEAKYGREAVWVDQGPSVPVFAIQGFAEAANLPVQSARVLVAKIAKWAEIEQKIVVVSRNAFSSKDGTDITITGYYKDLGFTKLFMDDGSYDLVYSGTSLSDTKQLMVGVDLSDNGSVNMNIGSNPLDGDFYSSQ